MKLSAEGGIAPFWGHGNLPEKVSRDMGYRSDSIAISLDMRPLSPLAVRRRTIVRTKRRWLSLMSREGLANSASCFQKLGEAHSALET